MLTTPLESTLAPARLSCVPRGAHRRLSSRRAAAAQCIGETCGGTLQTLDLSWCRAVSENAVGRMADALPALTSLTLFGCSQVTARLRDGLASDTLQVVV